MSVHVMLDLETLATTPDALILSIGAAKFDSQTFEILDTFHTAIDPTSAAKFGGQVDPATILWWFGETLGPARKAMLDLQKEAVEICTALDGFAAWFGPDSLTVWGNGATFDNVVLRRAYQRAGMGDECPWSFRHDACYRTLKNLAPDVKAKKSDLQHDALADVLYQVKHLKAVVEALNIRLI